MCLANVTFNFEIVYAGISVVKMEEKLSVLETLGAVQGLTDIKNWNVLWKSAPQVKSSSPKSHQDKCHCKDCSDKTKETKKRKNQTGLPKVENLNLNLFYNENLATYSEYEPTSVNFFNETNQGNKNILKMSCDIMEEIKSKSDDSQAGLSEEQTLFPMASEDSENVKDSSSELRNDEETEKPEYLESKKNVLITPESDNLKKMNSGDGGFGMFDEFESSESDDINKENTVNGATDKKIPSTVQEWVNHLPSKNEVSPDPVEIFLNLGFGGVPGVDMENCRIPKRFLVPSRCKGGDWNEFLKRELIQAQNFECSSLGFRGLSGPSYRRPSAIVANIMEKLRERTVPQPHGRSRFSTVARRVLNEKSVLNKLTSEFQSVLSPDNRKFLQNQGKISPEVPRRRIIFGKKSFAFGHDGELVEVESAGAQPKTNQDNSGSLVSKPSKGDSEESNVFGNSDVLLKLRRSSLQKQKNVDEDSDVEDVFYVVGNDDNSTDTDLCSYKSSKCLRKTEKIPQRFLSSTNVRTEKELDLSEAMRLEIETEMKNLSQEIKNISNQDLALILKQVKKLRSKIDSSSKESTEV